MKSLLLFKTESLNTYILSKSKRLKQTMLVHPDLIPFLFGKQESIEEGYYARKANFLRSNFITEQDFFERRISPEQIEQSFYNFNQIVYS